MRTNKFRGLFDFRLFLTMILVGAIMLVVVISDTPHELYVNGRIVNTKQGTPAVRRDVLYVPAKAIVEGMGDKYEWNDSTRTATITKSDGTKINIKNGKSIIDISGKTVPLETKVVNEVKVPLDTKTFMSRKIFYVPLSFVKDHLDYPVTIEQVGGKTNIYVGKLPEMAESKPNSTSTPNETQKPTPKPDNTSTTPTSSETSKPTETPTGTGEISKAQIEKNIDWMVENLGFQKTTSTSAMYNPINKSIHGSVISVGTDTDDIFEAIIMFKGWKPDKYLPENEKVRPIAKELFNFYFPNEGDKFFELVDSLYDGKNLDYMEKILYFDNRAVLMYTTTGNNYLCMYIGPVGRQIRLNMDAMRFEIVK